MKKWFDEEYSFEIEVLSVSHNNSTENHCRNGDEVGDLYTCGYGCPVNAGGHGFCQKSMMIAFPIMEAVRSGGDLVNIGGSERYTKEFYCPDGVVKYRLIAKKCGEKNFHRDGFYKE